MMGHHATNKQVNLHDNAVNTKEIIAQPQKSLNPIISKVTSVTPIFIFPFDTTLNAVSFGEILLI
jgi:hypothetical protein